MKKEDFIVGENIKDLKIYEYDDRGNEWIREICGKVIQVTNDLVVIDNGKYKESFKYNSFTRNMPNNKTEEPYDLSLETYKNDIVSTCIENINKNGEGFVFTSEQLAKVIDSLEGMEVNTTIGTGKYKGIYFINKQK